MTVNAPPGSGVEKPKTGYWIRMVLLVCLSVSVLSVVSRVHFIQTRPLAGRLDGQEPEGHVLVTDMAFEQTSWKVHHFLPLFTLAEPYDKFIDQHPGAESADRFGNFYYCSTPPLTFVIPYAVFKLTGNHPNLIGLRWYNVGLQVLTSLALAGLVWLCVQSRGGGRELPLLAAATVAVIYMTAPECLKSHTINLWAQQFYSFLLVVQIICLLFYPSTMLLFVLAFVGCLADWTPYFANSAMAGLAFFSWYKSRDPKALYSSIAIMAGCLLGGLCLILWFASEMPVTAYFHNLMLRSSSRGGHLWTLAQLVVRYPNSFGIFGLVGLAVLGCRPWARFHPVPGAWRGLILADKDPLLVVLAVLGIALVENLFMAGHAYLYTYDRLKGVEFLAVFVVWGTVWSRPLLVRFYIVSVVAGLLCVGFFWRTYDQAGGWSHVPHSQQERLGDIITRTVSTNGPAFFNGDVRGAEVYYAHRNICELAKTNGDPVLFAQAWCRQHQFTEGTLYEISGHYPEPEPGDFPRSVTVRRIYPEGGTKDLGVFPMPEQRGDYFSPPWTTNRMWQVLIWQP